MKCFFIAGLGFAVTLRQGSDFSLVLFISTSTKMNMPMDHLQIAFEEIGCGIAPWKMKHMI